MWHKAIAALALCQFINPFGVQAATWPDPSDEIEDLMMLASGYRARGFPNAVTPCTNSPIPGFRTAAGFVRTAFHDIASHDEAAGTGGLDCSIAYELDGPFEKLNAGPVFNASLTYIQGFFNSKASMSDLLALGVYASVRSCGGPQIPMKSGRIDGTQAGPVALPDTRDSKEVLLGRFAKMGFDTQGMIALVACGHTLGGVHPHQNRAITVQNSGAAQAKGVLTFDRTDAAFDNAVAREYIDGTTRNPLVVFPVQPGQPDPNSDKRVFSVDNNVTIKAMADNPGTFDGLCQDILQQMLEKVPSGVSLSNEIVAYDVKPGHLNLNVIENGNALAFSGEVRIRTTQLSQGSIASVQIVYKDHDGNGCNDCKIGTKYAGSATGFDESFAFYGFSSRVPSISSFNVVVTSTSGQQKIYDNNGNGFPVNDGAFVQMSSSSYSNSKLSVTVAVRSASKSRKRQSSTPQMTLFIKPATVFGSLPTLQQRSLSVSKTCSDSLWTYYSGTINLSPADAKRAKLEVSVGGQSVDSFRDINFPGTATPLTCGGGSTTTTTTTTSSTTSSSSTTPTLTTTSYRGYGNYSTTTTQSTTTSSTTTTTSSTTSSSTDDDVSSTTSYDAPDWTIWDPVESSEPTMIVPYPEPSYTDWPDTTTTVTAITTYCPGPTKITHGTITYTITEATTYTITDCPCTITIPGGYGPPGDSGYGGDSSDELEIVYEQNYSIEAPDGGVEGADQNTQGLDLSVTVQIVTPTITGTKAVGPTDDAWSSMTTVNSKPSVTQSGKGSKFSGAANGLVARGEVALMGAAAVAGAVALVL